MITVHGLLGEPTPRLRTEAASADWVVGGRRHLDALAVPEERRITLGALRIAVEKIRELDESAEVVVIASGDPLFFGVVRSLRAQGLRPQVVSAPSSIASAFAAVGLPWDDAVVVSVHGRPLAAAVNLARAHPKVAVFTSADNSIRSITAGLADLERWYVLAERLGETDEQIRVLDAAAASQIVPAEPNVVLVLDRAPSESDPTWQGVVARPDRAQRPQVTPLAALAFARTLPEPGELVWAIEEFGCEVASLATWSGAAVQFDPATGNESSHPDVIVGPGHLDLAALLTTTTPRVVALSGVRSDDLLPASYLWTTETLRHHGRDHHLTTGVRR